MKTYRKKYNLNGVNANIVSISDIHYYDKNDMKNLNKVLESISKINPQYICIIGDLTDEANIHDEELLIKWLVDLSNISKVIISLGNHEFYIDKFKGIYGLNEKLFNKIKKIKNLYLLNNENIIIDDINFIGLTLPVDYYLKEENIFTDVEKYFRTIKLKKNYYNILLCHSPIKLLNEKLLKKYNINLILCGHTHGGMIPRFFRPIFQTKGIISPSKKIGLKTLYGHLKICNTDIIITSGITVVSNMNEYQKFKNLYDMEIVDIKIKK